VDTLLSIFLIGISFGFILFLLGTGLSLTLGLMRIVNLAHGALYMSGAYAGLAAAKHTGNFLAGLLFASLCTGLIGLIMERGFLKKLYRQEQSQVLLTIGFIYIMTNLIQWIWGPQPLGGITPAAFSGYLAIGTINFPIFRLVIIAFGFMMAILLWLFQDKTRIGAIVRAGMDNREVATALGINLKVIFTGMFALASFIAGLCGLMGAPLLGVNLQIGWDTLTLAMIVVIVGGTGSIQGALCGGLIIGLLDSFGKAYFPDFAYFIIYIALILILLFKPSGLLGRPLHFQKTADQLVKVPITKGGRREEQLIRRGTVQGNGSTWYHRLIPYLAVVIFLLAVPPFISTYYVSMLTKVLIFAIFAISLDLVLGYTGLTSFGHAAFLGIGGYTVGILAIRMNIDLFWILVPAAIAAAVVAAAIIGFISLRVSGIYFLLVTMAFGQLLSVIATKWSSLTGGTDGLVGIMRPNLGIPGFTLTSSGFYYLVFIIFAICFFILRRIAHSSFGKALVGIRENEMRMRSLGYNTWLLKYAAVIIAGAFAGVAGVLYAYFYGAMVPSNLALETSASAMLMVIIGGPGTLFGPFVGAAIVVLCEHFSSIFVPERWPLILGSIFIICVMLVRGGFAQYLSGFWRRVNFQGVTPASMISTIKH
jgi:branched-chain amino acid transport system permease protein